MQKKNWGLQFTFTKNRETQATVEDSIADETRISSCVTDTLSHIRLGFWITGKRVLACHFVIFFTQFFVLDTRYFCVPVLALTLILARSLSPSSSFEVDALRNECTIINE